MNITILNNTGYDIHECTMYYGGRRKDVDWFEDGDTISMPVGNTTPSLLGTIEGDVFVESDARPLEKIGRTVVKWAFNKVHETDL